MNNQFEKLKKKSDEMLNLTKEQFSKGFNFAKIKSNTVKDKISFKIREKAILATKARLAENHKTFNDFSDDELEIIIADEERKIIDDLKSKSLVAALAVLGLNFFV
ncbi:hypothetical protein OAR97_03595 [Arcobacteraceae bacterium]|nr:hypothetical protein [Arcobacteraceae bacterium]